MDPDTDTESECEYYKLARERVLGNLTGSVSKSCVPGPPASVVGGSSSMDTRGTSNSHKPSELDVKDKMGATVRWFSSFDPHHRDVSPESTTNAYTQQIRELERLVFSGKASGVYEGSRTFAIFPIGFKAKTATNQHTVSSGKTTRRESRRRPLVRSIPRSPRSAGGQRATTGQPGTCGTAPRKTAGWVGKCHIPPRRWDGPAKQARTYSKKRVAEEMGRDVFDYRVVDSRR
jgi:hypothetical protein